MNSFFFIKCLNKYNSFDIVANFFAHKHVRSEKDNVSIDLIKNNIFDAQRLLEYLRPIIFFVFKSDKTNLLKKLFPSKNNGN